MNTQKKHRSHIGGTKRFRSSKMLKNRRDAFQRQAARLERQLVKAEGQK